MGDALVTGKGTSWEIKPGVYQYRFSMGKDSETGKYRYSPKRTLHCKSKNKRGREAELREAMEAYKTELNTGVAPAKSTPQTVGEYAEQFHALRRGTMRSPLSYDREGYDIAHIKALFGDVRLTALKPPIIKEAYAKARERGTFSESELHKIHAKLRQIMQEAVDDELIVKNPCAKISVPRPQAMERQALSAEEAHRLLECLQEGDIEAHKVAVLLMLSTGMRRGEALGLTWEHVNLESKDIYICQQYAKDKTLREPKSAMSKRHLSISEGLADVLKAWKGTQAEYLLSLAERQTERTPVVSNDLGRHMDPNNFNRWFRDWCCEFGFGERTEGAEPYTDSQGHRRVRKRGYSGLTPHMLRHTQATLLIGANADIKTVQARLGHSSVNLTLNTYSHAIAAKDREAADTFASIIGDTKNARSTENDAGEAV